MTNYLRRTIAVTLIVLGFQSCLAMAQSTSLVPVDIQVPVGNVLYLKGQAAGTQNYVCLATESGLAWKFIGPQATVFVGIPVFNRTILQQVATHFLSPNPLEGGTGRATWQSSIDSSAAWAKAIASSSDPSVVAPGAIPWLLLQVVGTQLGPTGGFTFAQTTYIQRLNTSGGVMPATGCSQIANVGATAFVPYTADYYFYRAGH